MKAEKWFVPLLLLAVAVASMAGCTHKTKYDDKQVVKIETQVHTDDGFVGYGMRLFDFESGTVTDKVVVSDDGFGYLLQLYEEDPSQYTEYESADAYREYLLAHYNVSVSVAEFSQEDGNGFVSDAKSHGIYTWRESYENNSICGASTQYIIITFADGTTKTTRFYSKHPKNFDKVEAAFTNYFGVGAWCGLRLG